MRRPTIVAHRGGSAIAPENTLASVRAALGHGAGGIEIDVRATADGVVVLMHDDTVERTTGGRGRVDAMPLAALRRLDAASLWRSRAVAPEPPPTLLEVLRAVDGRATVFVEVKPPGIERAVVAAIAEAGALGWAEVHSFLDDVIAEAKRIEPRLTTALVCAERPGDPIAAASELGASAVALWRGLVARDPAIPDRAAAAGLRRYVWTVNDSAEARVLARLGVDALITDRPSLLDG